MSSILAATAWDPIRNQPYGLVGSDSQGSIKQEDGTIIPYCYNSEKILISKDSKRLAGVAGTSLNTKEMQYPKGIKNQLFMLERLANPTKEDYKRIAEEINKVWENFEEMPSHFLFMDYLNGKINLHEYSGEFTPDIKAGSLGSGRKYILEKFPELISKYAKNRTIVCPIEKLSQIFIETLNHAKNDDYTGGKMSLGITTPKRAVLIDNFAELNENSNEKDAEIKYFESMNNLILGLAESNPKFKGKKLEDLIFT